MILEYIIEDDKYQELIKDKLPKKGKKGTIRVTNRKFSGVNNYILTIQYNSSPVDGAEVLSNVAKTIKAIFDANKVQYYILRDEASITFVNRLYPLVCEFETKLRKFIYIALFDLDEPAQKLAANKIKTAVPKFSKTEKIPQHNFLESITLGEVFTLLFDNKEFLDSAKNETKQIENTLSRRATKKDLIRILEAIEEKTLWNELFRPSFSDFSLPEVQDELFSVRNDVMHFHFIDYEQYTKALKMLKDINQELDAQIAKGIVLENNEENAELVSNNYQYTYTALSALVETMQSLGESMSTAVLSSWAPMANAITNNYMLPLYEMADKLSSVLGKLYGVNDSDSSLGNTNDGINDQKADELEQTEESNSTKSDPQ